MSITPTEADPRRKTISPYDLSSSDNPGAIISQPLLNGLNYDEWAINFRMALSSRKKFGFLDGSIAKPAIDSPYLEDWIANNHLIVGWIKQTIEPKIRSSISTREIAKDLWDIIKKRFSIKSGARLQHLRNSLANCKQNGTSVDDCFGRFTKLWDGIAECMNSKRCSCGKCECDLNSARDKELEVLQVHDFLSGLDYSIHGVIRSQICAITPLPDLDSVYQTIVQNETIHKHTTSDTTLMSFASQVHFRTISTSDVSRQTGAVDSMRPGIVNKDPSRYCTGCGRKGHELTSCFEVVGYPEWWGDRPRGRPISSVARGRGVPPKASIAQINSPNSTQIGANMVITQSDRQGLSGISDDQWQIIQRMLAKGTHMERLSGESSPASCVLDTGATHHEK